MITLSAKKGIALNCHGEVPIIGRVSTNANLPNVIRDQHIYIFNDLKEIPQGFAAYISFGIHEVIHTGANNIFHLPEELAYLEDGDVIKLIPSTGGVRVIHRKSAHHNALLVTERCNSFCLMCSQPPRDIDDSYLVNEIEQAIPLIDKNAIEVCISGGEPTLLGDSFFRLVKKLKLYLPNTAVHILSNGRLFSEFQMAKRLAEINHTDLMVGIPLYSDVSNAHDFVVQACGAYNQTIKGILNLKSAGVMVELRVVVHKQTYQRLPQLADFIARNLTFVDHVAIMGLEMTGFTKVNLDALWIDPVDYQHQLVDAVHLLSKYRINTSIYNHQLCLLDPCLHDYNVKSISDWKNEYMPECEGCERKQECGGFFSSAVLRYSDHITPFKQ